jgi:hypothetical protein
MSEERSLILKDVHYVMPAGEYYGDHPCRPAMVTGDDIDTADLYAILTWRDVWRGDGPPDFMKERFMVAGVEYDKRGAPKTWHVEDDCPFR